MDNQKSYADGYDLIFKNKSKNKKSKKTNSKFCSTCNQAMDLIEQKTKPNKTWSFFACVNHECKRYNRPPEIIENCGSHDTFTWRAGHNLEKAQAERRVAEEASHMGRTSDIYREMDDFGAGQFDPSKW